MFINGCHNHTSMNKKLFPQHGIAYCAFRCRDRKPITEVIKGFQSALECVKSATHHTSIHPESEFRVSSLEDGIHSSLCGDKRTIERLAILLRFHGANLFIESAFPCKKNSLAAHDLLRTMKLIYGGTSLFSAETALREQIPIKLFYMNDAGLYVSNPKAVL
jgi:hypothetical protein